MKTTHFLVFLLILIGINKSNSQINNAIYPANNSTIGNNSTFVGINAGLNTSTGDTNTGIGKDALKNNTTGNFNCAIGPALDSNTTGNGNIGIGHAALSSNQIGSNNTAFGYGALPALTSGDNNLAIGLYAGRFLRSGSNNIIIGSNSISSDLNGNGNVFIGKTNLNNSPTSTNVAGNDTNGAIILSSGIANSPTNTRQRIFISDQGNTGIGLGDNIIPKNRLDVKGAMAIGTNYTSTALVSGPIAPVNGLIVEGNVGVGTSTPANKLQITANTANASGLRFTNLTNTNFTPTSTSARRVLSVNQNGDVILVDDIGGGVNATCSNANFLPIFSSTANTLGCSQIFDNGTGVGVGYSTIPTDATFFNYNFNSSFYTNYTGNDAVNSTNAIKLHVNGNARANGIWTTSDKKFKKEIKSIEKALETIQSLEGKTYFWDTEKNKEMNFDNGGHSGFIAQELEKVLPHLVATSNNGNKVVNYMEIMPYLVEAIKEQQVQINDLKMQISDNFKTQNKELINLQNTKIISVSPNPSKDVITISFNIEKTVQTATLNVHDLNGNVLSSLNVKDRDVNLTRTIQKDNFGKGIYIVSLVINGKSIDTKKIIFE